MSAGDGYVVGTTKVVDQGPDSARWNLVIIGDGYRDSELTKYHTDVQNFLATLRLTPPYDELFSGINVHRIDVVSTDSGADDPGCAGGAAITANTYFDATFCTLFAGTPLDRLLSVNTTLALSVASAQVPLRHQVLCIVNSSKYGGSGGTIATCSTNAMATKIAIHEIGHSAYGLADEYGGNGMGTPAGEPTEPNVTRNTNRATNKWKALIAATTPMPSKCDSSCIASTCTPPATPPAAGAVGTYEGGKYSDCNIYRPLPSCYMRDYGPFCPVCAGVIRQTLQPFLIGLPAHDLYLRDNLQDYGSEPLVGGGISCSPDIIIFNQELLDPEAELGTAAAQQSDTLGNPVASGQDNFIYLRVQNRGTQPTSGTARVFWANPSVLPAPASWTEITDAANPIVIPAVNPQEMKIIGPVVWEKADIPGKGHYCFVGLINSGNDPAPDPATIHTIDDYYNFIRQSNNATWKNFDVTDILKNSLTSMGFSIQGWPRIKLSADLMIDLSQLPGDMQVTLRILKRLSSSASLVNAKLVRDAAIYQKFELVAGTQAFLCGMNLKTSDICQATLEIITPQQIPDGNYRLSVAELIDGKEMGRVTRMLALGEYPYLGNRRTREVHIANCDWAARTSRRNKEAYQDLESALKHGYDGCHYCLPEYSKD